MGYVGFFTRKGSIALLTYLKHAYSWIVLFLKDLKRLFLLGTLDSIMLQGPKRVIPLRNIKILFMLWYHYTIIITANNKLQVTKNYRKIYPFVNLSSKCLFLDTIMLQGPKKVIPSSYVLLPLYYHHNYHNCE